MISNTQITAQPEYDIQFWNAMRNKEAREDILANGRDISTGTYSMPTVATGKVMNEIEKESDFRKIATVIRAYKNGYRIFAKDCKDKAEFVAEGAAIPVYESAGDFNEKTIASYKLASIVTLDEDFVEEMKEQGIHLVPIIDAGVKIEKGYPVYEEGVRENYFCKEENGEDFVGAVWPGKVHFPDVLNEKARAWFGGKYRWLIAQGIDGFWNDMNEPAIFYSEKNLKKVLEEISSIQDDNLDLNDFFHMQEIVEGLCNHPQDYKSFYHDMNGQKVCHDRVHNLYGFYMTRAASEAFERIAPDERLLLFSRSSYIGMHRYGGIWTGDNESWWSHLLLSIQQMPSLNLCGILYTGSDLGGFGSDATEDLLLRWTAFSIFTPLMRNHSAAGTRRQEAYQFEAAESFRRLIRIRYGLLTYLYSEYMKAALSDALYFRPLSFDYPEDAHAYLVEDQLMVGESLMIAPVYMQNAKGRYVYLPEEMLMVRMRSDKERTYQTLAGGHHYLDVALDEVVFFVKKNHMLPFAVLGDDAKTTQDVFTDRLVWIGIADEKAEYVLYEDDGISKNYAPRSEWKTVCRKREELENEKQESSKSEFVTHL